ncbi:unnamed protein product [Oncorhynchus mykiss]|uniref:Endonuclease/exonuclease/phosphatase domain-containing protein n=1 Tax=Oncorhynchus mykiss TaxID=8022 RepID=A0A060VR03_ONCMY|nr:unnamed protein product [Oncorhynchus mykiss]
MQTWEKRGNQTKTDEGKADELLANLRFQHEYREACLLAFTESWLDDRVLDGFTLVRADRDLTVTGKPHGGGVCLLVRDQWCKSILVRETLCTPNIELLSVSLQPYYLPSEFPQLFVTVVYIQLKANIIKASEIIYNLSQKLESHSPKAPKFIFGDFNNCTLHKVLRTYHQYVKCHTRKNRTLDLCYGTIPKAFSATTRHPMGTSDHNVANLLEREKPTVKTVQIWNDNSITCLQGCFDCTMWEVFEYSSSDLDELIDVISDYANFCVESVVPTKTCKLFPNNKPWVSKHLKLLLDRKKAVYAGALRDVQRQIKRQILVDKEAYKQRVERTLASGNARVAWQGIKSMASAPHIGRGKTSADLGGYEGQNMANELNVFFSRFESDIFLSEVKQVEASLQMFQRVVVQQSDVLKLFRGYYFVEWFEESHLVLNTNKTKEMCIDFRMRTTPTSATSIRGQNIEIVEEYKYLGVLLDNKLQWSKCTDLIYKKSQQRLFCLKKFFFLL